MSRWTYLLDDTGKMDLQDVVKRTHQLIPVTNYQLPSVSKPVWLRFELVNDTREPVQLVLDMSRYLQYDIALYDADQLDQALYQTGVGFPVSSRSYDFPVVAFPLELQAGSEKTYYLKMHNYFKCIFVSAFK